MTKNQKAIAVGVATFLVIAGVAAGASYFTRNSIQSEQVAQAPQPAHHYHARQATQANAIAPSAGQPPCNDHNIVGTLIGGAAGGIAGHQIGKGSGRTVATIGGAAGGAYLGNEYLNTRNATCN